MLATSMRREVLSTSISAIKPTSLEFLQPSPKYPPPTKFSCPPPQLPFLFVGFPQNFSAFNFWTLFQCCRQTVTQFDSLFSPPLLAWAQTEQMMKNTRSTMAVNGCYIHKAIGERLFKTHKISVRTGYEHCKSPRGQFV